VPGTRLDPAWEPALGFEGADSPLWAPYMAVARRIVGRFQGRYQLRHFDYEHPAGLQPGTPRRLRRAYKVRVAYTDWGPPDAPVLLCCGGVSSVAMRFNYLASDLAPAFRVVCMDWVGRGRSGWLADEADYALPSYVEQLRQMVRHLGKGPVTLLGSSMGGSAAIDLIATSPGLVQRLILNDVGPHIAAARRRRRAEAIARHYVFRSPAELQRRVGASQKNDGPASDDIRFNLSFHQTRWSADEGGRVYRHDVRAMQAYRRDAQRSLQQWPQWRHVQCPVLLIHGLQSDALLPSTIERMRRGKPLALMCVPDTGHTPLLADRNQTWFIRRWLQDSSLVAGCWTVLHAPPRQAYGGRPTARSPGNGAQA
jgi:pimeloyl-ACP methyl ester carboxylesterase